VEPATAALVERMKGAKALDSLLALGKALSAIESHVRPQEAQQGLKLLSPTSQKTLWDADCAAAWVRLEQVADRDLDAGKRIQKYVDLLAVPLVVGEARTPLLEGLETLTGAKFEGDLWKFVDWATTTDRGKAMHLQLDKRPH
jgi:hypothetical protein